LPGGFKKSAPFCRDLLLLPIKELLAQGNQRVEVKGRKNFGLWEISTFQDKWEREKGVPVVLFLSVSWW
jgi:hypothetical protein